MELNRYMRLSIHWRRVSALIQTTQLFHLLFLWALLQHYGLFFGCGNIGGYSGDLSPKSAFELLSGDSNAVLIDVRSEELREKDGIPDIRRAARFRYASVTPIEVDGSIRKLLKGGKDLDDSLVAVVIQNLKIVKDSSKVIVLDADGTRSKGIARSLKKIGIKNPYLVEGDI